MNTQNLTTSSMTLNQLHFIYHLSGSDKDSGFPDFVIEKIEKEGWDVHLLTTEQASDLIKWLLKGG